MTRQKYEFPSIPPDHIWLKFHNGSANHGRYIRWLLTKVPAGWASVASGMCSWMHGSLLRADRFETHLCLFLLIPCSWTLPRRSSGCKSLPCQWNKAQHQLLKAPVAGREVPSRNWTEKSCCWKPRNEEVPWHSPPRTLPTPGLLAEVKT